MSRAFKLPSMLAVHLLFVAASAVSVSRAAEVPESARHAAVLRRAELKRNPFLGTAVELDLRTVERRSQRELRRATYLIITHRTDRTLVLPRGAEAGAQGAMLLADAAYRMLPAGASRPIVLPMRSVLAGDLAHLGFLRVNLRLDHELEQAREDSLDGRPCWSLQLSSERPDLPFRRVRYWIETESLRPLRLEYRDEGDALVKTVDFLDWQDLSIGEAPLSMEIRDAARPDELTRVRLSRPERVPTRDLRFDDAALHALREWAERRAAAAAPQAREFVELLLARAEGEEEDRR